MSSQRPPMGRHLLVAGGLMVLVTVLAMTGVPNRLWSWASGFLDSWRADLVEDHTPPEPADTATSELIARLSAENMELRRRLREFEDLYGPGGLLDARAPRLRARIIARSDDDGRHFLEIDRGADQGLAVGDPVLAGSTLVGRVRGMQVDHALVQLLTDSRCRVPAQLLTEDTEDPDPFLAEGVLAGIGESGTLDLRFVEQRPGLEVLPGQRLITAGLDPRIPPGLLLGTVIRAETRPGSDHWRITVKPQRPWGSYPTVVVLPKTVSP